MGPHLGKRKKLDLGPTNELNELTIESQNAIGSASDFDNFFVFDVTQNFGGRMLVIVMPKPRLPVGTPAARK